jgi:hypothetical protein
MENVVEVLPVELESILEDMVATLQKVRPEVYEEYFVNGTEDKLVELHHGYGTYLRNHYKLWGLEDKAPPIVNFFNSLGIWHADDMSGILITSLYRWLQAQEVKLYEQVQFYKDYWAMFGEIPKNKNITTMYT